MIGLCKQDWEFRKLDINFHADSLWFRQQYISQENFRLHEEYKPLRKFFVEFYLPKLDFVWDQAMDTKEEHQKKFLLKRQNAVNNRWYRFLKRIFVTVEQTDELVANTSDRMDKKAQKKARTEEGGAEEAAAPDPEEMVFALAHTLWTEEEEGGAEEAAAPDPEEMAFALAHTLQTEEEIKKDYAHFDAETFAQYTHLQQSVKSLKKKAMKFECINSLAHLAVKLGANNTEVKAWLKDAADMRRCDIRSILSEEKHEGVPLVSRALDIAVLHDDFRLFDFIARNGGFGRTRDFSAFVKIASSFGDQGLPAATAMLQNSWWKTDLGVPMCDYTPLMHASKKGAKGLVKLFLECGEEHANAAYKNRLGESALFLAAVHEDEECARLIEAHLLNIATKGARCVMSAATLKLEAVTSAAMAGFAATKQAAITRKEER